MSYVSQRILKFLLISINLQQSTNQHCQHSRQFYLHDCVVYIFGNGHDNFGNIMYIIRMLSLFLGLKLNSP